MSDRSYHSRVEAEKRNYADCVNVEDLPDIFHYWSNRHIRPRLKRFGFDSPKGMIRKYIDEQSALGNGGRLRFLSIGCGNCELEIDLASQLRANGHANSIIDCLDLNAAMLDRAGVAAAQTGVENQINRVQCDFNEWEPSLAYDAVIANQALHHVLNLEHLLTHVKKSLKPGGRFIVSDMIGRNGHQLWPEALHILREIWCKLPPSYRFNHQLRRYEECFVNRDYSHDSFEAIRSQDILPLLLRLFHFELFVGFGNIINPFVDRSFGLNFAPGEEWDRSFIDEVHARDEQEMLRGHIKPTQMLAVLSNDASVPTTYIEPLSPDFCVRWPSAGDDDYSPDIAHLPIYRWGAWPHSSDSELQIACGRLSEAARLMDLVEKEREEQQTEIEKRTVWARQRETELAERTAWALQLEKENAALTAVALQLDQACQESSAWALQLDKELAERAATVLQLQKELDERTAWALRLSDEFEERTAWALKLNRELERTEWVRSLADRCHRLVHLPGRVARRFGKWLE